MAQFDNYDSEQPEQSTIGQYMPAHYDQAHLDVTVRFLGYEIVEGNVVKVVKEYGVNRMEVWLYADPLHNQILRHPWHPRALC